MSNIDDMMIEADPHIDGGNDEASKVKFTLDNVDDFRLHLARELHDKPELCNTIFDFSQEVASKINTLSHEVEQRERTLRETLDRTERELAEANKKAENAQTIAAHLSKTAKFQEFAQPAVKPVDPLETFKKELDNSNLAKRKFSY